MKFSMEPSEQSKNLYVFALIAFAFLFSLCIRLSWLYPMDEGRLNAFTYNGEFMVTTNDSYLWAEGARDLINCDRNNASMGEYYQQHCHQENDMSPVTEALPLLAYFLAKVLPFSLETIMFYLPAFGGSLVVIPMILMGRRLHLLTASFIGALLTSIGISYYSRTVLGYFDTDVFNFLFPMLLVWSISLSLKTRDKRYLLLTGLEIVIYRWCYPSSYSLEFAFFGLVLLYTLVYERKSAYHYQLLSIMLIGMMGLPFLYRLVGVLVIFGLSMRKELEKYALYILIASAVLFIISGGVNPIIAQLNSYIFQREGTIAEGNLHFFSVTQTIVEAQGISMFQIAERSGGTLVWFVIGLIGYGWLCFRQPVLLIMTPLLGLGVIIAKAGGLRFVMYAIPVISMGIGFFIFRLSEVIHSLLDDKKHSRLSSAPQSVKNGFIAHILENKSSITAAAFVCIATLICLYPSVKNAWLYKTGTVFNRQEVELIENFGKTASREDYVLTWWDYGYPIRYYADVKTLVDGGKHSGDVNFPVSFALSHDQKSAANMARLDVEYTEKRARTIKENLQKPKNEQTQIPQNNIAWIMKDYGYSDPNDLMIALKTDMQLPQKSRDIYFYLPLRMLDIYTTIMRFSYLNLADGKETRPPFFYVSRQWRDSQTMVQFDNGLAWDKQKGLLIYPNQQKTSYNIRRFVRAAYQNDGTLKTDVQNMHFSGTHTLIFLPTYGVFLIVDEEMYNSVYIKLFYLEDYDKDLFELVASNPYGKFFKLKL